MTNMRASDNTSIVTVNRVFHRPGTLDDFTGKDLTVLLRSPLSPGASVILATEVVVYSASLGVVEVTRFDASSDTARIREAINDALRADADQTLKHRLDSATLVVFGVVDTTRPAPAAFRGAQGAEHWPDWWETVVRPTQILKGNSQGLVTLLFPNSTDVVWGDSPKFRIGQRGIWILRLDSLPLTPPGRYFSALNRLDFQPEDQVSRVRTLLSTK